MASAARWPDAVVAGLAASMRTFSAPAGLALRGRISGKPRVATFALAAGELATDKTAVATDRTDPPAVGGRMAAGAYTGNALAGPAGAAAGAAGAFVGTFATFRARKLVVETTGLPDPVVAVGEDLIAYSLAALATRREPEPVPPAEAEPATRERPLAADVGAGLAAALAGTAAMTIAQGAEFVLTDAEPSTAPADVLDKVKRAAGFGRLKRKHVPAANQVMHWSLGTSWGVPLGLFIHGGRVRPELAGPAFGLFVWVAALGHQPALGVADVPWKRSPASLGSEALFHLVYGIGAGAALRALGR